MQLVHTQLFPQNMFQVSDRHQLFHGKSLCRS